MSIFQDQYKARVSTQRLKEIGGFPQHAPGIDMRNFWVEQGKITRVQHIKAFEKAGKVLRRC